MANKFGFMKALWLVLGMFSVVILHKYILKKPKNVDQIKGLSEVFFRRKIFYRIAKRKKHRFVSSKIRC
jgi:hypothetical protein